MPRLDQLAEEQFDLPPQLLPFHHLAGGGVSIRASQYLGLPTRWLRPAMPPINYIDSHYNNVEPGTGRRYRLDNLTAPGGATKGNPNYEFLGVTRYWRYSKETMQQLYKEGRIVLPKSGEVPAYKRYLDEMPGLPGQDIWKDINSINSQAIEALGYPTQKPSKLLERVINLSSNEGDLVLDCFCGSGTTAAVAEKLGRRWIACDLGRFAIHTTRKRLLQIPDVRPFVVQNLGKYECQLWQTGQFALNGPETPEQAA